MVERTQVRFSLKEVASAAKRAPATVIYHQNCGQIPLAIDEWGYTRQQMDEIVQYFLFRPRNERIGRYKVEIVQKPMAYPAEPEDKIHRRST